MNAVSNPVIKSSNSIAYKEFEQLISIIIQSHESAVVICTPMHIVMVHDAVLPAAKYGGTERVVWWLVKALSQLGHEVTLIARQGTVCPYASVLVMGENPGSQIPPSADIVHIHSGMDTRKAPVPYVYTMHGNAYDFSDMDLNRIFVSKSHAAMYGSDVYVYNGIDPADYGDPALGKAREYCHFLGMASWKVKNVKGAIRVAQKAGTPMQVMGGHRVSFSKPFRVTLDPKIQFTGLVGGEEKNGIMRGSKALVFPVLWSEPFGLAITESLYFGCPVLGTPYGSLPELVHPEVGYLSASANELAERLRHIAHYNKQKCHEFIMDQHTSLHMAKAYLEKYEIVINGKTLHQQPPCFTKEAAAEVFPFT